MANTNEVVVMGTQNSGCADMELPTLNNDSARPMLMVSHANTDPGLVWCGLAKVRDTGEPAKHYPSGTKTYGPLITTDDFQGVGAVALAALDFKVTLAHVLDDDRTYLRSGCRAGPRP